MMSRTMMCAVAVSLAFVSVPAGAQSLADVARAEAARREAIGRAPTVYTNSRLVVLPPAAPVAAPRQNAFEANEQFLERREAVAREQARGPIFVVIGTPTQGPFGEFAPFPEPRRLDGTLLSQPPWHASAYAGGFVVGRSRSFLASPSARPIDRPRPTPLMDVPNRRGRR